MKKVFLILIIVLASPFGACSQKSSNAKDAYIISVDPGNLRLIKVSAELELTNNQLSMNWHAGNSVEKGWAHFVEDLKVFDSKGKPVSYEYVDKATWNLDTRDKTVKITYEVHLNHDKINWTEGGHSAASYVLDDGFYSIGAAIFIAPPTDIIAERKAKPATITYNLPDDFNIAIPWNSTGKANHQYEVGTTYELVRTGMFIGKFPKQVKTVAGAEIEIATANDFQAAVPLFQSIYDPLIPVVLDYFDDTSPGKYIVIANQAPRTEEFGPYFSGEALHQTMSLIAPIVPTEDYLAMFWYFLTHEYLHMWIGHSIQTADPETGGWMMEGFTDYISLKLLHNMGVFPDEILINGMVMAGNGTGWGYNINKYLASAGTVSMHDAGDQKQDNYEMVYSGGSTFALILDIEMNAVSNGKAGMDQLIRTLNKKFSLRKEGRPIVINDVKQTVSELCGKNLDHLFDKYVMGTEIIPIGTFLEKAGLVINNTGKADQKISVNPKANNEQKAVLKGIAGISL